MTIPAALIEEVARRMCVAQGLDQDALGFFRPGGYGCIMWRSFEDRARDAIAAHIALAEIMPPDRATLLAVADVFQDFADTIPTHPDQGFAQELGRVADAVPIDRKVFFAVLAVTTGGFREVAAALRAKAGGGE